MSDSIKKYNELVEEGKLTPNRIKKGYTELELVETVATLRDMLERICRLRYYMRWRRMN